MIETTISEGENNLFMDILKENFGSNFEIDYTDIENRTPYIIVDQREKRSGIIEKLENLGAEVIVRTLDSGDYLVSNNSGVERKRGDDYYGSLFSGSIKHQYNREKRSFLLDIFLIFYFNFFLLIFSKHPTDF